jgi:hypothetical protein
MKNNPSLNLKCKANLKLFEAFARYGGAYYSLKKANIYYKYNINSNNIHT